MKIGICAALVLAVGLLVAVAVHISRSQNSPVAADDDLPIPAAPSNSVPELPPEVTSALANPTNLPDDITPASQMPVVVPGGPGTAPVSASTPVAAPVAAPVETASPTAVASAVARHRAGVSHYRVATVVVRRGDTLWHIARTHHTTVRALKAANGLRGDLIRVGQKLRIPHAGFSAARTHHRTYHHHGGVVRSTWHRLKASYRRRRR
jgi:LysM repeat protein